MASLFIKKLERICRKNESLVCVGLDVDMNRIPTFLHDVGEPVLTFNRAIIDATHDLVCAYKLNIAFYEVLGAEGLQQFRKTVDHIPDDVIKIVDAKRGDIGNTARMYAKSCFEYYGGDAVTASPYLGRDSLQPFLDYEEKCTFVLCLTSNPGSKDFQYLSLGGKTLYQLVAENVNRWNEKRNCGLVVGATHPEELKKVREIAPELPFLIPGIGAQGGDVGQTVRFGTDKKGERAIINSSRGIIYASAGKDFADAARAKTKELREAINTWRS
ncbi:MAG: orotidine-5'-phosphate decarboxylase [Gemmatimonadota bacterium]|nr:MAG: orotidine-5'-phosphate decarboxylase [Gemmatimonadota bacterium]